MSAEPCANPVHHRPAYAYTDRHHKLPESWGGPTEPDNLVALCQTCHHAVHWLIDQGLERDGVPELRKFNPFVRELARYAYEHRPPNARPTIPHWRPTAP